MSYASKVRQGRAIAKRTNSLSRLKAFIHGAGIVSASGLGLESAEDLVTNDNIDQVEDTVTRVRDELTETLPNETEVTVVNGEEVETDATATDAQVDSAINVMKLAGDTPALEKYLGGEHSLTSGYDVQGHFGVDVLAERVGVEHFAEQQLTAHTEITMNYNVRGQRQGRLAELFFRTTVLPPEAPYAKFELYAPQIVRDRKRVIDKVGAHSYTRLLDAAIDHTLLNRRGTAAIPVHQNSGGFNTTAYFVAGHPTRVETIGDDSFNTAPLALGKSINLINISARPGLVQSGVLDNTDTLEASVRLTTLVASIPSGGADVFVHFPVENLPSMQFIAADNSVGDEVQFSHNGNFAVIDATTTALDGIATPFSGLAGTYDGKVILSSGVSGQFNLNTGIGHVNATGGDITVSGYVAPGSTTVDTDPTTLQAIAAILTDLTLVGYEVKAARTNLAKRHEGILLSTLPVKEAYRVELSEPLLAQLPVAVSTQRAEEIASQLLVGGSRLRNNNLAITKLVSTAAAMRSQSVLNSVTNVVMECEGIARHLIRPTFLYKEVNFDNGLVVSSIKSHERAADISAAITNEIRMMAANLWVNSNLESAYQYAADQGSLSKPKLAIGTDPIISQHLMVTGDTRLVGVRFDYELAYDMDARVRNNVFLAFVSADHQYLTFGQHFWVTEIVTNLQITRDGRTVRELQVQPRNRYVVTLPVLGQIVCQNLDKALLDPTIPTIPTQEVAGP